MELTFAEPGCVQVVFGSQDFCCNQGPFCNFLIIGSAEQGEVASVTCFVDIFAVFVYSGRRLCLTPTDVATKNSQK